MGWPRPREGIFMEGSSVPLREVAVIKRLPGGDGIAIMSYVKGLGVKLGDILFVLPCWSVTVALSFTEKSFYVSSKFTEEPLYARVGLDLIDITVHVENLIRKLYMMYELEEQDKRKMQEKQNHLVTGEPMCQQEELRLQLEKLELLKQKREETKKYKSMREEMKKMVRKPFTDEELEAIRKSSGRRRTRKRNIVPYEAESDWVNLFEEELCQSEERCNESLESSIEPILKIDRLNLGGGGGRASKGTAV